MPAPSDQAAPEVRTATGRAVRAAADARAQQGSHLTTANGLRLPETDHSLTAGERGPVLLQDHHLREKITHFDHERIPERVVHARGAGAHGVFVANGAAANLTRAAFLQSGVETPVFVRFSTVLGSRGSADTPRDTRGFAVKFYTSEGTYDLVGNNIPVFFIQDAIKFPDIIHAGKPEPDREIPQAASAHDTFWDFVSLHTEAQHHTIWNMSDRALPLSFRTMEGFGVHTFRFVDADGGTSLIKLHWKPEAGVHSQLWEEAQLTAGGDPDFMRRDLADAIQNGALPTWELGVQVFEDTEDQTFEGIDLLDPTKIVPEELAPVQTIGTLTLTANPTNFFAETEQVAFHPGHLVPGIEVTNDPLLQGRLFSYIDTQITRLGGPNFTQLPDQPPARRRQRHAARRTAPARRAQRQGAVPPELPRRRLPLPGAWRPGRLPRGLERGLGRGGDGITRRRSRTTSLSRGCSTGRSPHRAGARHRRVLVRAVQGHLAPGPRATAECLALIDQRLCAEVATALGLPAPEPDPEIEVVDLPTSAALAQVHPGTRHPVAGRRLGIVADQATPIGDLATAVDAAQDAGLMVFVLGPHAGTARADGGTFAVDKPLFQVRSFELDAVLLTTPTSPGPDVPSRRDAKTGNPDAPRRRVRSPAAPAAGRAVPPGQADPGAHGCRRRARPCPHPARRRGSRARRRRHRAGARGCRAPR